MKDEITRNTVHQIKKDTSRQTRSVLKLTNDEDNNDDNDIKPDKATSKSGNTNKTGKSFLQEGKTSNDDLKDFREGHNTASVPGREQLNNSDTHKSQECATKNPNNNKKNNKQTCSSDKSAIKYYACSEFSHYRTDKECSLYGKKATKVTTFVLTDYDDEYDDDDYNHQFIVCGSLS